MGRFRHLRKRLRYLALVYPADKKRRATVGAAQCQSERIIGGALFDQARAWTGGPETHATRLLSK